MKQLFGARSRHSVWRKLWLLLAEAEKEVGVEGITDEALEQMRAHVTLTDEDFAVAAVEEKRRRHDVMAREFPLLSKLNNGREGSLERTRKRDRS